MSGDADDLEKMSLSTAWCEKIIEKKIFGYTDLMQVEKKNLPTLNGREKMYFYLDQKVLV